MLTAEQLARRKIGGSSVATILGMSQYKSAIEEFHELIGHIEREDLSTKRSVVFGEKAEPFIAGITEWELSQRWGRDVKLRKCNLTLVHKQHDFITCHIDRDVVGLDRGVEIKNVGARVAYEWGPEGTDEIPDHYLPQPHTYMLVKDYPVWTVAAYFGGDDLRLYEVERDREWDELIIGKSHAFWHHHVLPARAAIAAGMPIDEVLAQYEPAHDLDAGRPARHVDVMRRIYPGTNGKTIPAPDSAVHWREVHLEAAKLRNEYETDVDHAKAHLLRLMGEAAVMEFPDGYKLTRKLVKRKGYAVDDTSYVDWRVKKPGKGTAANDSQQEAA